MFASILVELIKLKRSKIMLVALSGPGLVALLFFALQASGADMKVWPFYLFAGFTAWATFMLPLTATIITTLVAQLEHGPKTWAHILALPVPKWRHFGAKAIVALGLIGAMSLLTGALLVFGGWLAGEVSSHKLVDPAPLMALAENMMSEEDRDMSFGGDVDVALMVKEWRLVLAQRLAYVYLSAFLLIAVQLWAAFRFRNFLIPMALGVGGGFFAIFAQASAYGIYFPWLMPFNTLGFMPEKVQMALSLGLVGGLGAILLMLIDMSRMQIK
ncbi:MAG: ABC transporter permease [Parvularculaceae bacterium]